MEKGTIVFIVLVIIAFLLGVAYTIYGIKTGQCNEFLQILGRC